MTIVIASWFLVITCMHQVAKKYAPISLKNILRHENVGLRFQIREFFSGRGMPIPFGVT